MSHPPPENSTKSALTAGFTLIELSMVLMVIGLLVGGVLTAQDLIKAAQVRAQVTQLERYNTAANTFRIIYNYLPGDVPGLLATSLGLVARAGTRGRGDGNGLIEGYNYQSAVVTPSLQSGETVFFWEDLSSAQLMDYGPFNTAIDVERNAVNLAALPLFIPPAKIGGGNFMYVYSGGTWPSGASDGFNYFGLSSAQSITADQGILISNPGLTVAQAYAIDLKVDDGLPSSGKVQANYVTNWNLNPSTDGVEASASATTPSSSTCYDQGGNSSNPWQYSMSQSGGSNMNCGLSFRAQF